MLVDSEEIRGGAVLRTTVDRRPRRAVRRPDRGAHARVAVPRPAPPRQFELRVAPLPDLTPPARIVRVPLRMNQLAREGGLLECDDCGTMVVRLAIFRDEGDELIGTCDDCETDHVISLW